jgi:hypothetical protein
MSSFAGSRELHRPVGLRLNDESPVADPVS